MLIGILATLKLGMAYVPVDPNYPDERISYILEDTKAKIILANEIYQPKIKKIIKNSNINMPVSPLILAIDNRLNRTTVSQYPKENLQAKISSNNLAYVIYTSGTTGKPKGVLQLHSNVTRLFSATAKLYEFNDKDVWTLFHSFVFDFSV